MGEHPYSKDIREKVSDYIFSVTSEDILSERDVAENWSKVNEADRRELRAFIRHGVFRARHRREMKNRNCILVVLIRASGTSMLVECLMR